MKERIQLPTIEHCTGCQACRVACPKNAITMQENEKGNIYPVVNEQQCINCNKCANVCPELSPLTFNAKQEKVYAMWVNNTKNRKCSTSGGASYIMAKTIIERGGYLCGAIYNDGGAEHRICNNIDELYRFQGSKYVHSNVKDVYKEVEMLLKNGKEVLFTGTPCQVAALRSYLIKEYDTLYCIDIVCRGVPNKKVLGNRIKAIEKGAPYKIAANITFGNFYLVATGNDEDKIMSQDDTIILFGQNQTPDLLFHYLYGNEFDSSIEYVSAVSDAAKCLVTGKNLITSSVVDYVFIAQPVLYNVLNNKNALTYQKAYVYKNIQEEYSKTTNNMSLVQASVFVKNDSDQRLIKSFLNQLENDIENAIKDPNVVKESMDKISKEEATSLFGINSDVAKLVLEDNNGIGLGYKKASENKKDIDKYISLFGLNETNKEIYFK